MEITPEQLKKLLGEAFDQGYENSQEFKEQCIEEILAGYKDRQEEQYRIFKVAELKGMPEGTIFHHSTRGRCWIIGLPDGTKQMQFEKGQKLNLTNDNEPWDRPMRLLHTEKRHA
jgi:hypothetical protein